MHPRSNPRPSCTGPAAAGHAGSSIAVALKRRVVMPQREGLGRVHLVATRLHTVAVEPPAAGAATGPRRVAVKPPAAGAATGPRRVA
eukprot:114944-Chlamydomonas_euryale.AAC.1